MNHKILENYSKPCRYYQRFIDARIQAMRRKMPIRVYKIVNGVETVIYYKK